MPPECVQSICPLSSRVSGVCEIYMNRSHLLTPLMTVEVTLKFPFPFSFFLMNAEAPTS